MEKPGLRPMAALLLWFGECCCIRSMLRLLMLPLMECGMWMRPYMLLHTRTARIDLGLARQVWPSLHTGKYRGRRRADESPSCLQTSQPHSFIHSFPSMCVSGFAGGPSRSSFALSLTPPRKKVTLLVTIPSHLTHARQFREFLYRGFDRTAGQTARRRPPPTR